MRTALIAAVVIHAALITGCALHKSVRIAQYNGVCMDEQGFSLCQTPQASHADPGDQPYYDAANWMHEHIGDYVADKDYAQYEQQEIKAVQDDLNAEMILRPADRKMWHNAVKKAMDDYHALAAYDNELHNRDVL